MITRLTGSAVAVVLVAVLAHACCGNATGTERLARLGARGWGSRRTCGLRTRTDPPSGVVFAKKGSGGVEGTFSPTDADLMFFTRFSEKPFSDDIYRGSLATGEVSRVIGGRSADLAPTVSPDGTQDRVLLGAAGPKRIREDRLRRRSASRSQTSTAAAPVS